MTLYWLTPLNSLQPLALGAERMAIPAGPELDEFRSKLHAVHPRLLMLFKASLLFGCEEPMDTCGAWEPELSLAMEGDIVLGQPDRPLSHCAQAFIERLDSADEMKRRLDSTLRAGNWSRQELVWLARIGGWLEQNRQVMLLREDGSV